MAVDCVHHSKKALSGSLGRQRLEQGTGGRDGSEDAALHCHHLDGSRMVPPIRRGAAILQKQALESPVVCLAHRCVDAERLS